jgi:hypothetical protein
VKCIEDLREKREEINKQILKDEEEKAKIQRDLSLLTDRLSGINEALARKIQVIDIKYIVLFLCIMYPCLLYRRRGTSMIKQFRRQKRHT